MFLTGAAGFIGYHTARTLLSEGYQILGHDNLNDYYDPELKKDRLKELGISAEEFRDGEVVSSSRFADFSFVKGDLKDREALDKLVKDFAPDTILHLAAQAGVRYSIENPTVYVESNVVGFFNILEICRHQGIRRLVYASSSSIYGNSDEVPFREDANVDHPVSLYAATKKSNELFAHTYSHLYGINTIGLRFFTVYGPWGRPDMAPFLFTEAIVNEKPIKIFNHGKLRRDFTFISDIAGGISAVLRQPVKEGGYGIFNIGNNRPEELGDFIRLLEKHIGKEAVKEYLPMQPGDVYQTYADVEALNNFCGYQPKVSLDEGLKHFVNWYLNYYH